MKALRNRLRRLEIVAAPDQEDQSIVEAIEAARKRRMGSVYEPRPPIPPEMLLGCRTIADHILLSRRLKTERLQARHNSSKPQDEVATATLAGERSTS